MPSQDITTIELDVNPQADPFRQGLFQLTAAGIVQTTGPLPPRDNGSPVTKRRRAIEFFAYKIAGGDTIALSGKQETPGVTTYTLTPYSTVGPMGSRLEEGVCRATERDETDTQPIILKARLYGRTYVNGACVPQG